MRSLLKDRVLLLDGGMGTMVQTYCLDEQQYRSLRFASLPGKQLGNNDLLVLSRPDIVAAIHKSYLDAGADIITTNTFNAQRISLADYSCQHLVVEINKAAACLARKLADEYSVDGRKRFVAGSVGPTNKTLSISPDVQDAAYRSVSFDEMHSAYLEQMTALIQGGVDALLIETIFDTLNAKAAILAAYDSMRIAQRNVELMLSFTIGDNSGRTLSGQTIESFVASVEHANPLSIGMNCGYGIERMSQYLRKLSAIAPCYVSAHPNAGLPNELGKYEETPQQMASAFLPLLKDGVVNIIGGCCGTTPEHIHALRDLIDTANYMVRVSSSNKPESGLVLSGLDAVDFGSCSFVPIGERCNVAGSRKFLRLIKEKNYDEAIAIARQQVRDGAMAIDVSFDDAMLDASSEISHFLNLLAGDPDAARVPVMIDSSDWDVILSGLKCLQGKGIVNSISLKEGEQVFVQHAHDIMRFGAAVVVMLFDEEGQATNFTRRCKVAKRSYDILTGVVGMHPKNIIFDPNVLAVATGIDEHNTYGIDFIRSVKWIRDNLPGVQISGGISNLSFSFRGNNYLREAMHSVFLHHTTNCGMNMAIVNAATRQDYESIPPQLVEAIDDVLLNRCPDPASRLLAVSQPTVEDKKDDTFEPVQQTTVEQRLINALIKGDDRGLQADLVESLEAYGSATKVIDGPLMDGMKRVGVLFGEGQMFLPQVVRTARVMKKAVDILQPFINKEKTSDAYSGRVLLATVKGDVHDIGKNIVGVVMSCGGYEIVDMGVMVSPEEIVKAALTNKPDIIGLSGLITPSLNEMINTVDALEKAGLKCPVMIGGATTSALHTALMIAPHYSGVVAWVQDASQNAPLANSLLSGESDRTIRQIKDWQQKLRNDYSQKQNISLGEARLKKLNLYD